MCSVSFLISHLTGIESYFIILLLKTPSRAAVLFLSLPTSVCSVQLFMYKVLEVRDHVLFRSNC